MSRKAHLEDVHDDVGRSGGEIVVDCLGVVYPLPHTRHACELLLINVPCYIVLITETKFPPYQLIKPLVTNS